MGDSSKKSLSGPWGVFAVVILAMFAFVRYVRMQYWWAHNNPPFAIWNGIGLTLSVLLLLGWLSNLTGALGGLSYSLIDYIETIFGPIGRRLGAFLFEKLPSPVVAIVGGVFLIAGVLEMVLYVWCMFCFSFDLAVAAAAAGFYILKRKYSVPDF